MNKKRCSEYSYGCRYATIISIYSITGMASDSLHGVEELLFQVWSKFYFSG